MWTKTAHAQLVSKQLNSNVQNKRAKNELNVNTHYMEHFWHNIFVATNNSFYFRLCCPCEQIPKITLKTSLFSLMSFALLCVLCRMTLFGDVFVLYTQKHEIEILTSFLSRFFQQFATKVACRTYQLFLWQHWLRSGQSKPNVG